ncbi:MAG: class I SAM-dependent methyltransferase [Bacteroidia bacterium]|nr:class I SAM-dependent methyltransferase [Bacteroidia bacterium]
MKEYWENKFQKTDTAWGDEPADSAIQTCNFFLQNKIRNVLIPGIGYGRNAKVFVENGMNVTGIEISATAIKLAKEKSNLDITIHNGSVNQMPFDNTKFDGIFCYALIHLLNKNERKRFLNNCYNQLLANGFMIFVVVSKKDNMYGSGKQLSKDRFELMKGLNVYFYDLDSATKEFENYGLIDIQEIDEPIKHMKNHPPLKLLMIKCQKVG